MSNISLPHTCPISFVATLDMVDGDGTSRPSPRSYLNGRRVS
jgi:hypothetical protein